MNRVHIGVLRDHTLSLVAYCSGIEVETIWHAFQILNTWFGRITYQPNSQHHTLATPAAATGTLAGTQTPLPTARSSCCCKRCSGLLPPTLEQRQTPYTQTIQKTCNTGTVRLSHLTVHLLLLAPTWSSERHVACSCSAIVRCSRLRTYSFSPSGVWLCARVASTIIMTEFMFTETKQYKQYIAFHSCYDNQR